MWASRRLGSRRDQTSLSSNGCYPCFPKKELPIGESNPGRERDRLECYQLHQPGLSSVNRHLLTTRIDSTQVFERSLTVYPQGLQW